MPAFQQLSSLVIEKIGKIKTTSSVRSTKETCQSKLSPIYSKLAGGVLDTLCKDPTVIVIVT